MGTVTPINSNKRIEIRKIESADKEHEKKLSPVYGKKLRGFIILINTHITSAV